jgi:hypothetical protein
MFERLAGKLLGDFLSKYFTEESLAKNKVSTSTQLGVWSGYVSLQNLELKKDVINTKLHRKGLPFEIVHCSFRQVEITIPWAKITNPINTSSAGEDDAVVVVVLDGIHVLARTSFEFHDVALREEESQQRRRALEEAGSFGKDDTEAQSMSYTEMIKKRLKEGLLQEIAAKVHIHMRDLHVRLEDVESDPQNPYACGITMESMHVQHDDEEDAVYGIVSRVAQLNHFAVYWNALEYGHGLPFGNTVLHQTCRGDPETLSRALNFCIARRASVIASPSRNPNIPRHTYLLLPVDGTWHGSVSTRPDDLSSKPAMEAIITIEPVSAQIRDFQCVQILRLVSEIKNHEFVKKYRKFRPLVSVKENPRVWWLYAARVIRYQLRESFLRWSWSRFETEYRLRGRYMELYERKLRFPSEIQNETLERLSSNVDESDILNRSRQPAGATNLQRNSSEALNGVAVMYATPDAGAGPSIPAVQDPDINHLNRDELIELQDLEDGLEGNLSVRDIILFRAVVNMRLGRSINEMPQDNAKRSPWWKSTVERVAVDDSEAKEEFDRLLLYLDKSSEQSSSIDSTSLSQTAISVMVRFEKLSIALLSPLHLTAEESQLRRLHEHFFELSIIDLRLGYSLKGDYKSKEFQLSMFDLVGTEIRADKSHHIVASQVDKANRTPDNSFDMQQVDQGDPLLVVTLAQNAPGSSSCDVELAVFVNTLEIKLTPDCEWITHAKDFLKQATKLPNVADFWNDLSFAYVNSLALGHLGLLVKAETAAYDHKNVNIEITVQCPVVRIGDGTGCDLIVDLGIAHFKTEKLAGISRTKLKNLPQLENGDTTFADKSNDRVSTSLDEGSVMGSVSARTWASRSRFESNTPKRKSERKFSVPSSAFSVDSRNQNGLGNRSFAGSLYFDDAMSFARVNSNGGKKGRENENSHAFFYDVYEFRLHTGKVTFSGETELFDLTTGFQVSTTFKKSVLPADHTICKLKAHTVVGNLNFELNESVILQIGNAIKTWKALVGMDLHSRASERRGSSLQRMSPVVPNPSTATIGPDPVEEGSLSQIDENEFFDANEGHDSFGGDASGLWFDDNWISDAESFIESDSRSLQNDRRGRRRRSASISDVSSASDQSPKGRKSQHETTYLSAANLIRLEENAGEDESLAESAIDMDNESFHSVMSTGGQEEVLRELEEDIRKADDDIMQLNAKMQDMGRNLSEETQGDHKKRRKERKSIKLELSRAQAECNALGALHDDLSALISEVPISSNGNAENAVDHALQLSATRNQEAKTTRALLTAKKRRDSMLESNGSHNLTRDLNRELFQGSILFNHFQITVHLEEESNEASSSRKPLSVFEFVATQTGLVLFHHANDTKVYFSLDQITAAVRSKSDSPVPTRLLLSGGSSDTLLPSHFPHLVSRSMEDRFLRGSLHFGKRRAIDLSSKYTQTLKLRLVLGDLEASPSEQGLAPLGNFLSTLDVALKKTGVSGDANNVGVTSSTDLDETILRRSTDRGTLVAAASLPSRYYDLAIRLTSIRIVLSHANQIVGASAITETAVRFVQFSSPLRNRMQIDLRCSNVQMLEIASLEAGRGSEIVGRRDPYSSLVQIRLRSQLVPSHESGGWVIGLENRAAENVSITPEQAVRNMHIGFKFNPISLVASPEAISMIVESARELKGVISKGHPSLQSPFPVNENKPPRKSSLLKLVLNDTPLRWRVDISLRRIAINFPDRRSDEWNITDDVGSKMLLAFTIVACLQESAVRRGCLSLQMGLTELALLRSSDDWPILETFSTLCDSCLENSFASVIGSHIHVESPQLKLNAESPLNEIAVVMHRYGWDCIPIQQSEVAEIGLTAKVTPLRANFSAPIIGLLVDTVRSLELVFSKDKNKETSDDPPSNGSLLQPSIKKRRRIGFHIVLEDVEWQLLRDADSKPISFAEPLVSFTMGDVRIDYEQGEQIAVSVLIRNSSLFDLSSARGVRVIGENPVGHSVENPYFVRVKLYIDKHSDGPKTIRLEINWGRIQCLLLPSFLRSVVSLQDDVKSILEVSRPTRPEKPKRDILARFLNYSDDVNLILAAHAEAFEFILSSKDIVEYVRQSETEPIGVVTFRWKASLSVALALDCLRGSSVPWLTLDLDGKFTDSDDTNLFKDFANRYLSQSSGLLAGSGAIGHKLVNAFTARVSLCVSDFQVVRTNISSMQLKPSAKTVGLSYKSVHRMYFNVTPPPAGEQRITNPIDLDLVYRTVGASMADVTENERTLPQVEISQLLQVKAKFVDVLLYISQSSEGFTEAFKVTVKPVLDILKRKDTRRKKEDAESQEPQLEMEKSRLRSRTMLELLRSASSICTIQFEGFQITCVPGGATRLNESPIIKFELSQFSSGVAAVPVPKDLRLMAGRNRIRRNNSRSLPSGVDVMHLTTAGWIACEITGHYHNRRLVAWEPFIEPWVADIRFGADLVEALKIAPTTIMGLGELRSPSESRQSGFDPFNAVSLHDGTGDRLRDFGRLFRAPFQSAPSSKQTADDTVLITHTDFCYLMLASTTRTTILSVLYPNSDTTQEKEARLFSSLPGRGKIDWLRGFGLPGFLRNDGQESADQYSLSCSLSDTKPLNINLTGALLENVLGYLDSVKKDELRTVAPHWIRNGTGMVRI